MLGCTQYANPEYPQLGNIGLEYDVYSIDNAGIIENLYSSN